MEFSFDWSTVDTKLAEIGAQIVTEQARCQKAIEEAEKLEQDQEALLHTCTHALNRQIMQRPWQTKWHALQQDLRQRHSQLRAVRVEKARTLLSLIGSYIIAVLRRLLGK